MGRQFRIGAVLVEPDLCRVSMNAREVVMEPKVMDVLVTIADGSGDVVSRTAIEAAVWPGTHVSYHSVARAISEARKALDHLAPGVRFIETVPRRGYRMSAPTRFVSPVEQQRHLEVVPIGRGFVIATGVLALGLGAHATGMHGSAVHLAVLAVVVASSPWWSRSAAARKGL